MPTPNESFDPAIVRGITPLTPSEDDDEYHAPFRSIYDAADDTHSWDGNPFHDQPSDDDYDTTPYNEGDIGSDYTQKPFFKRTRWQRAERHAGLGGVSAIASLLCFIANRIHHAPVLFTMSAIMAAGNNPDAPACRAIKDQMVALKPVLPEPKTWYQRGKPVTEADNDDDLDGEEKVCSRCRFPYPFSHYLKSSRNKAAQCKKCRAEIRKAGAFRMPPRKKTT
jgi:hypothetical protein